MRASLPTSVDCAEWSTHLGATTYYPEHSPSAAHEKYCGGHICGNIIAPGNPICEACVRHFPKSPFHALHVTSCAPLFCRAPTDAAARANIMQKELRPFRGEGAVSLYKGILLYARARTLV